MPVPSPVHGKWRPSFIESYCFGGWRCRPPVPVPDGVGRRSPCPPPSPGHDSTLLQPNVGIICPRCIRLASAIRNGRTSTHLPPRARGSCCRSRLGKGKKAASLFRTSSRPSAVRLDPKEMHIEQADPGSCMLFAHAGCEGSGVRRSGTVPGECHLAPMSSANSKRPSADRMTCCKHAIPHPLPSLASRCTPGARHHFGQWWLRGKPRTRQRRPAYSPTSFRPEGSSSQIWR